MIQDRFDGQLNIVHTKRRGEVAIYPEPWVQDAFYAFAKMLQGTEFRVIDIGRNT